MCVFGVKHHQDPDGLFWESAISCCEGRAGAGELQLQSHDDCHPGHLGKTPGRPWRSLDSSAGMER